MNAPSLRLAIVAAVFVAVPLTLCSQAPSASALDALVDLLLLKAHSPINAKAYPPGVRTELRRYLQRYESYRSKQPRPAKMASLEGMVYDARVTYERRLAAVSADPKAPARAEAYVDRLRPCYEWEGYHDCPEREAEFAVAYQQAHPGGPFRDYLPLLAAHRWLCAAEGYDYEKKPGEAARSRKAYAQMIMTARQSSSPLIRLAAETLAARNTCDP